MALNFIDVIASIFQSIVFSYTITYCMNKSKKIDKKRLFYIALLFLSILVLFTNIFGESWGMSLFITHILALLVTILFYKKDILSAITVYTIIYFVEQVYSVLFGNLIFAYVTEIFPITYIDYEKFFIIYAPEWILLSIYIKYIDVIKKIHKYIIDEKFAIVFLVMSFFLDFILTFYVLTLGGKSQLTKNVIYIIFFICFGLILVYFWKVHEKSEQIHKLNEALETKNGELRKIKHDYGAQISYLYGLCLMERFDDLKKALKDIINNNDSTPTAVEVNNNENSLLSLALKPAIDKGIHVIVDEKCDFSLINMNEMEIYRVVSNIVNNAIKAMKGQGIIIAKSYEHLGNTIIKIENNGPKIEEHYLKDIFKVGFTTKDNTDKSHGYGLSIVKDLVESYNGKIFVKSNDTATEFKIVLPISNLYKDNKSKLNNIYC